MGTPAPQARCLAEVPGGGGSPSARIPAAAVARGLEELSPPAGGGTDLSWSWGRGWGGCKGVGGRGQDCGWNWGRATGEGAEQGWDCRQKGRAGPRACTAQPSRLLAGHHEPEVATAADGRTRDVHHAACGQLLPRAGQLSSHCCDLPWGPGCCPVDAVPPLDLQPRPPPLQLETIAPRSVFCHH